MSDEEDADVDSGWDLGEDPPTQAVDSSRLIAQARKLLPKATDREEAATISSKPTDPPPPLVDPLATTREVPATGVAALLDDVDLELAPVTRRATDDELRLATLRAKPSPDSIRERAGPVANRSPAIRLGGRAIPGKGDGSARENVDARVHNRPTPPARLAAQPAPVPPGAHTSLRFPTNILKDARARKATTKINVADVLDRVALEEAEASSPPAVADAGLVEIDLDGFDSKPPRAPDRDSSPDPLADLPVDEAIESARKTMPPPVSRSAASRSAGHGEPQPPAAKAKPSLAERMAGVVDQLTRGEALANDKDVAKKPPPAASRAAAPPPARPRPSALVRSAAPTKPGAQPVRARTTAQTNVAAPAKAEPATPLAGNAGSGPDVTVAVEEATLTQEEAATLDGLDSLDLALGDTPKPTAKMLSLDDPGALSPTGDSAPPFLDPLSDPPAAPVEELDPELVPIEQRFGRGDYLGALLRAEALLESRPDCEPARRYVDSASELLKQMYLEKLGSGNEVLRLAMEPSQIQGLSFDHRAGFLISLIDGMATVDEILDMSGMPQLDALRLLYEMREEGVLSVDSLAEP